MTARATATPPLPPEVLLTAEEFLRLPPTEGRQELHDGVVVEMPPPSPAHGAVQSRLDRRLGNWCEAQGLPEPLGEMACRLAPRRVVGPDLSWLRPGPRRAAALGRSALAGPPDLAAEILSPGNAPAAVRKKVRWYLEAGCPLVWVLDPRRRTATVHRPDAAPRRLGAGDALDGEDVLPGFRLPLADLWGALGPR
jgi:Uma2 family endonuclease